MRTILFCACFLFTSITFSQYPMNFRKAPKNPIPLQYTTEHYLIYHNVKSLRYQIGYIDWLFQFDNEGRSVSLDTGTGVTKYSYDSKGFLKSIDDGYVVARYKTNDSGYIIQEKYNDGSGSTFHYNEQGLFSEKRDLPTGQTLEQHTYDSEGRITGTVLFGDSGEIWQRSMFAYEDEVKYTKVTEIITDTYGNKQNQVHYFTKRGEPLSADHLNDTFEYDIKSNLKSYYNSADGTTTTFDFTYH